MCGGIVVPLWFILPILIVVTYFRSERNWRDNKRLRVTRKCTQREKHGKREQIWRGWPLSSNSEKKRPRSESPKDCVSFKRVATLKIAGQYLALQSKLGKPTVLGRSQSSKPQTLYTFHLNKIVEYSGVNGFPIMLC